MRAPPDTNILRTSPSACKKLLFPESFGPMSTLNIPRSTLTSCKHLNPLISARVSIP